MINLSTSFAKSLYATSEQKSEVGRQVFGRSWTEIIAAVLVYTMTSSGRWWRRSSATFALQKSQGEKLELAAEGGYQGADQRNSQLY